MFGDVECLAGLHTDDIDRAEHDLTRLTAACGPALTIIRLLHDTLGIAFDSGQPPSRMPGFLFDMNIFFQRLLSRFLRENLAGARIADELAIRNLFTYAPDANPRQRRAPAPRPDYALFYDKVLHGFLDAKYRDVWERSLPAEWLYQLSIYALASPSEVSVLLYASMSAEARDERVEVRQPVTGPTSGPRRSSCVRSHYPTSPTFSTPSRARSLADERRRLADQLVVPRLASSTCWQPTASCYRTYAPGWHSIGYLVYLVTHLHRARDKHIRISHPGQWAPLAGLP